MSYPESVAREEITFGPPTSKRAVPIQTESQIVRLRANRTTNPLTVFGTVPSATTLFIIGQTHKPFTLPTAALRAQSPFFRALADAPPGLPAALHHPDLDEIGFALFARWILLAGAAAASGPSSPCADDDGGDGGREPLRLLPGPTDFHGATHYVSLYAAAARFRVSALAREAVDHVRRYFAPPPPPDTPAPPPLPPPPPRPGAEGAAGEEGRGGSPAAATDSSYRACRGDAIPGLTASAFRLEHVYACTRDGDGDDGWGPSCGMRRFLVATAAYRMLCEDVISHSMRMVLEKGGPLAEDLLVAVLELCIVGGRDPREAKADTWHDRY